MHCVIEGSGDPAVFVHGSFGWGEDTFGPQLGLAGSHRIVLVDRAGYGASPASEQPGWPGDVDDVIRVLEREGGAHLVGQSYGAVVALLATQRRPDLVRSLVAIEPPAFHLAPHDADAARLAAAVEHLGRRAPGQTTAEFVEAWSGSVMGRSAERARAWMATWGPLDWAAAGTTRVERPPTSAPIDVDVLASAATPLHLAVGGWPVDVAPDGQPAARAFRAVAQELVSYAGATLPVFAASCHNPQLEEADAFNRFLRDVWAGRRGQVPERAPGAAAPGDATMG